MSCCRCCAPLEAECGLHPAAALDFALDGQPWKRAFGTASGLGACLPPVAFLAVRAVLFVFWLAVMIWSMVHWVNSSAEYQISAPRTNSSSPCVADTYTCPDGETVQRAADCSVPVCVIEYAYGFWFTQLTHWTLLFELVYLGFAASTTAMAQFGRVPDGTGRSGTPWFVSVTWALQPAVLVGSFLVFAMYWALLYDGGAVEAISVVTHGVNFGVMLVDFAICRQPFYLAHVYMPLAFALLYLLFSAIYYAAGGVYHKDLTSRYIYSVIDWSDPSSALKLGGAIMIIAIPTIYALFFMLYLVLRHRCFVGRAAAPVGSAVGAGSA